MPLATFGGYTSLLTAYAARKEAPVRGGPMATESDVLEFYRHARGMTDPGPHRELLAPLPRDIEDLSAVVQGLVLNFHTAGLYGVTYSEERLQDAHRRSLRAILARILELDDDPLDKPWQPADRFAGTCRDFT